MVQTTKEQAESKTAAPPYVSFRTLINFAEWLRQVGVPEQLDRSFWGEKLSGGYGAQLMAALRFLNFLDAEERPHADFEKFVSDPEKGKAILKERLQKHYAPLLNGLNLDRATTKQLDEKFSERGLTGATLRKARTFFVHAAKYAGVQLSNYITRKVRGTGEKRKAPRRGRVPNPKGTPAPATLEVPVDRAQAQNNLILWGYFKSLPTPGQVWPKEDREAWMRAMETAFTVVYKLE